MTARDLFISHSSGDAEAARALRAVLEDTGYSCWMAPDDIVGTETWTEQILAAIADSKAMIVLVSAASNKSPHVSREVNLALGKSRAVLPIRIEDVAPGGSLEYLLSLVQRVDAFPPPVSLHRDRILRHLDTIIERPSPATTAAPLATPPPPPPPTIDLGLAAEGSPGAATTPPPAAAAPPRVVVTPTSVVMPGLEVTGQGAGPSRRFGGATALVVGGGAVALVLAVVLGAGLLNGPGSSPKPSGAAIASPTAIATTTATAPPPTLTPLTAAEQQLQGGLPLVGAGTEGCSSWPTPPGGEDVLAPGGYATSRARLICPGPRAGGPDAQYVLYPTKAELEADYEAIMSSAGVATGGACSTAIPANSPWSFPAHPDSGHLACFTRLGGVQYVWTHNELRILAQWLAPDNATGYAFWQRWTTTFNASEQALLAALPDSVRDVGGCIRTADRYYETALAILACPRPTGQNVVFYAQFPSAASFPNDPMTVAFDSILTGGGFAEDTTTGCYDVEPVFGRYTWGYRTDGVVGDTEGYVGCYERTDTTPATAQFVWTFNRTAIMGQWTAPDLAAGIALFDSWIGEVR